MDSPPTLEIVGHMATISLCRPDKANRLTRDDLDTVAGYIRRVDADRSILVLRLQSSGKHFCSGYDLVALNAARGSDTDEFGVVVDALESARPITIASLHGGVFGGATDLCLACDFRVGTPDCVMQMPAVKLGVHLYASGLQRYVSRLGLNAAKRMLLTAEKIDCDAMLACGFLTELVPAAQLRARVDEVSQVLCGMAPLALFSMKKHLNRIAQGSLDPEDFAADIRAARECTDAAEGLAAWAEARTPVYTGS